MAWENVKILEGTHKADADLRTKQFFAGTISATGVALSGADEQGFPIQNKPNTGEQCSLGYAGVSKVSAGAAFNRGVQLATDANGQYITAVSGDKIVAIALETAGALNDVVSALLVQNGEVA